MDCNYHRWPWRKIVKLTSVLFVLGFAFRELSAGHLGFYIRVLPKVFKAKNASTVVLIHSDISAIPPKIIDQPVNHYEGIELDRDTSATNGQDVVRINHVSDKNQIQVFFATSGRCLHPYLKGRLSGPALIMLQNWRWTEAANGSGPIMTGTYQAPVDGVYFLELLMIYCNDFQYKVSQIDMEKRIHYTQFNFNFKRECIEDPWSNRLTKPGTTIHVNTTTTPAEIQSIVDGFWWNNNPDPTEHIPMMTRFQTKHCRENPNQTECLDKLSSDRFKHYHFQWSSPSIEGKMTTNKLWQENPNTICLIGQSHSRKLFESSQRINLYQDTNIRVLYPCEAQYPRNINATFIAKCILPQRCNQIVVAVGQWPASFVEHHPTLVGEFYEEIRVMFLRMRDTLPTDIEIFARSIHYNPINDVNSACPPYDWRTPLVIEAYNTVIEKAVRDVGGKSLNISFLDTNFLVAPVWDSGFDWCHLTNYTSDIEILYISAVAVGAVVPGRKSA